MQAVQTVLVQGTCGCSTLSPSRTLGCKGFSAPFSQMMSLVATPILAMCRTFQGHQLGKWLMLRLSFRSSETALLGNETKEQVGVCLIDKE